MNKKIIFTALFAALTSAGCFIQIPLPGGVPVTIQDMMAMLSGLLLGPLYGALAVFLFLVLGCVGLPVFTGKAGIQVILYGPTGGFLVGYLLAALTAGLVMKLLRVSGADEGRPERDQDGGAERTRRARKNAAEWLKIAAAAFLATAVVFAAGIIGFHRILPERTLPQILAATLIPFIPGNVVKILIMTALTKKLRPVLRGYIE